MKFKVLESNDYTYDSKCINVDKSWKLDKIKNRIINKPNRITFDPVESYFQELYHSWDKDKKYAVIFASFMTCMATMLFVVLLLLITGGI